MHKEDKKIPFSGRMLMVVVCICTLCLLQGSLSPLAAFAKEEAPEVELGRKVYAQIKSHLNYPKNPLIRQSMERIGKRILTGLPREPYEFRFFPIIAGDINAFALPNGYIFVTNELIQACDTEEELAFVLCHEIAHVERGHFMNFISQKTKVDITSLAVMVLGAMIARDTDLREGLPALTLGMNQNLTLSYSRTQEYEADTYGLRYLNHAGYSEEGASRFMDKLRLFSQITISVPAYLSTHPMPLDRLVNIKNLGDSFPSSPPSPSKINMKRVRLWSLLETELADRMLAEFSPGFEKDPNDIDAIYSFALIHEKKGAFEDAERFFKKGISRAPMDGDILRDYAIFQYRRGRLEEAEAGLRSATAANSEDILAYHYLGRVLMDRKMPDEAIQAFLTSRDTFPEFAENHHFLGILYSQQGNEEESHRSFERYFSLVGNEDAARLHARKIKQPENAPRQDPNQRH